MKMEVLKIKQKETIKIQKPMDTIPLLKEFYNLNKISKFQEIFSVITLDASNNVISVSFVTMGTLNNSIVHPREIFAKAISDHARAIIISHNHPSGNPNPSEEDIATTKSLILASYIIGIELLDHIIITTTQYFSFLEHQLIEEFENSKDLKNLLKAVK